MSDLIRREDVCREIQAGFDNGAFSWQDGQDLMDRINALPTASPWHRVEERLPKENNCYIVYLRQGTEMKTPEWMGGEPLSYVTEMGFDKEQMLWKYGDDAYNAVLSAVDTKKDFHVTHWTEKPEPPKEDA
jgi:hypothetical protein